jgi:hypothetical protein
VITQTHGGVEGAVRLFFLLLFIFAHFQTRRVHRKLRPQAS